MYDVLGLLLNLTVRPLYSLTYVCIQLCQGDGTHLKMEFCTDTSSQLCLYAFKPTHRSVLTHFLSVSVFFTHTHTFHSHLFLYLLYLSSYGIM